MKRRAVFLDRDGVINTSKVVERIPTPPREISEIVILPNVKTAVSRLQESGFVIVVVTNQPDIARGHISTNKVDEMNSHIGSLIGVDLFKVCPHDDLDRCICRKPKPGLIIQAAKDLNIDLKSSFMVGDRWRDVSAGQAAGCQVFFIDYNYGEERPNFPYTKVSSLFEATTMILEA